MASKWQTNGKQMASPGILTRGLEIFTILANKRQKNAIKWQLTRKLMTKPLKKNDKQMTNTETGTAASKKKYMG